MKCLSALGAIASLLASLPAMAQPGPEQDREPDPTVAESAPAPAPAPALAPPSNEAPENASPTPRLDVIRLNAGLKVGYVTSSGFDPFASNNALPQFSIDGTIPVYTRGKLVLGAGLGWDIGTRSTDARGLPASIVTHRLTVPLEARWSFLPGLYVFGKVAPGAALALATVRDPSSPRELGASGWAFATDASAGASLLLGPRRNLERRTVRFWVTPEAGYGFTTRARLGANPNRASGDLLGSDEDTSLRSLSLNGFFWRASLSATF